MILEGIVTTLGENGRVNVSPMGPIASPDLRTLTLRPFKSSQTYQNLKTHGEGVFHVIDDAEMLARAAVSDITPEMRRASAVNGWIIQGACRALELRVRSLDESTERASILVDVVRIETLRESFGFNRAKHAVVEAAILATRVHFLPREQILSKFDELAVLVQKTGGAAEERGFALLRDHVLTSPLPVPTSVRVRTGSRLHLGLIWPGGGGPRRFGGAGIMVEAPGVDLEAEPAEQLRVEGPMAARAESFARACGADTWPVHLRLLATPEEHSGLGTGTQLAMAVAKACDSLRGTSSPASELAVKTGRGRRSAIGIHGFQHGGFLVDGGKKDAAQLAPLLLRQDVPASWRFVLISPPSNTGLAGVNEEAAFQRLGEKGRAAAESLCHLLLVGMVPALVEQDLDAFGAALFEYGQRSGELFQQAQGGTYASPMAQSLVNELRSWSCAGVAQSSWGPTILAVTNGIDEAQSLAERIRQRFGDRAGAIKVTAPLNRGAAVEAKYT